MAWILAKHHACDPRLASKLPEPNESAWTEAPTILNNGFLNTSLVTWKSLEFLLLSMLILCELACFCWGIVGWLVLQKDTQTQTQTHAYYWVDDFCMTFMTREALGVWTRETFWFLDWIWTLISRVYHICFSTMFAFSATHDTKYHH